MIRVILGDQITPQLMVMLLNHTVLQHTKLFEFLTLEECVNLALKYTLVVSNEFLELPVVKQQLPASSVTGLLRSESADNGFRNYKQACKLLEETLLPVKVSPERLSFALLVNNLALDRYGTSVKEIATQRYYKRKTVIETDDNR